IFNGLVRMKPGTMNPETIEPDLAESWTASPDGKEWTFKLRPGVQCHGGYGEFTADDVVYSLARAGDPKRSAFSSDYKDFDKVEAVDPHTVKITLKNPVPSLLGLVINYQGGNMVCKKAAEELGENFAKKPIGTGPFMFDDYKSKESVTLVANKQYFRGAPKLDKIVYRYVYSDSSRDLAFTSGEIDLTYGKQDQTWVDRMKKEKNVVVDVFDPAELSTLYLNVTKPPLDDLRVRQAIAYGINRDQIVQFKGKDISRPAKSIVPIGYLGQSDDVPLLPYDPEKAKALLKEAGHPDGLTIHIIHTNLPGMLTMMEVVQAQLRKVGINLDMEVVEHATFHADIRKDMSPIVHYAAARFPVADVYLTQFFHSRSIVGTPTAVTNFSHCNDADAEIDAARVEPNPAKQKALWKTAQQKLMAKVCGIPIYEQPQIWARRATLDWGFKLQGSLSLGPPIDETTHFRE
ncbi:MAG: polyamine ABC transporter substrate-binding protein, partial [Alphaproteobacteria bacterium]|nr:polyamine ABC transporter substrate-binding protein [Alphaproteobacteria bacterium]